MKDGCQGEMFGAADDGRGMRLRRFSHANRLTIVSGKGVKCCKSLDMPMEFLHRIKRAGFLRCVQGAGSMAIHTHWRGAEIAAVMAN
jgi:hypothetical protein